MDRKQLTALFKQRDDLINKLIAVLEQQVQSSQRDLLKYFVAQFADKLQVDEDGLVKNNAFNRNLLLSVDSVFNAYGKTNNPLIIGAMIGGVGSVMDFNKKYYSALDGNAKLLPISQRVQTSLSGWLGIEKGAVKPNGYLDTLVKSEAVKNTIKTALMKTVYGQAGWQETKATLSKLIDGDRSSLGALEKYHRNFSYDLISQVDRATAKTYADDLKLNFAIYEGGLIKTSRPFCNEHNGNIYHRSEIQAFDPKVAKPPDYNPFTDLGGYACRHHLNWIPNALAKAMGKDIDKFKQPAGEIESTIDDLAKRTAEDLAKINRPDESIYVDFEAQSVATSKTTAQMKKEFGQPISTKRLYGKPNVSLPDYAKKELNYIRGDIASGKFKDYSRETVEIKNLNIAQQFVFTNPLKASTGKNEVFIIRYKNILHLMDGNHTAAKAFLNGSKTVKARIIDF